MKRSLALLLTALMMLSVCALSLQMVVLAATAEDNQPCDCGATVTVKVDAPTCSEWGGTWTTCDACGKKWVTNPTAPTGEHVWVESKTEPTCTDDGIVGHTCSECGITCGTQHPDCTVLPATGHNYETTTLPESCDQGGTITKVCTVCGDTVVTTVPPTGHVHQCGDEADVDYKAPTCSEAGFVKFVCAVEGCGDTIVAKFAALDHTPNTEKKDPTCAAYGYEIGGYCTVCNEVLDATLQLDKIAHTMVDQTADDVMENGEAGYQAPVCSAAGTTDGWQWKKCSVCGETEKVTLPASHTSVYKETVAPDCATKSNGYDLYECTVCGTTEQKNIVAYKHTYNNEPAPGQTVAYTFALVDTTITTNIVTIDGVSYYSADGLTIYYTTDATEAYTGFTQVMWAVQSFPSVTPDPLGGPDKIVDGVFLHMCTVCGEPDALEITIEHINLVKGATVAPTCTTAGYTIYTCDCHTTFNADSVPALGHLDENNIRHEDCTDTTGIKHDKVEPDCAAGQLGTQEYYYCADPNCPVDALKNPTLVPIPADHTYTDATTATIPATCAYPSFTVKTCSACGAVENEGDIAAQWAAKVAVVAGSTPVTTHTWVVGVYEYHEIVVMTAKIEPTCAEVGHEEVLRCTLCNANNKADTAVLPKLEAEFEITATVAGTCLSPEVNTYSCKHCVANGTTVHAPYDVVDANFDPTNGGHKMAGAEYDAEGNFVGFGTATPSSNGIVNAGSCATYPINYHNGYYQCSICGQENIEFSVKVPHTPGVGATCDDPQSCSVCGEELAEKLGHDWVLKSTTGATCVTDAIEHYECSRGCGVAIKDVTLTGSALGHAYNVEAPTCTEDKVCSRCGDFTDKLNHLLPDGTSAYVRVTDDATCTEPGLHTDTCSLCGDVLTTTIGALGHDFSVDVGIADRVADCLKYGYSNIRGCANGCGEYRGENFVAVKGHNMVTDTQLPTCEVDGYVKVHCSDCTHVESETVTPATGHWSVNGIDELFKICSYLENMAEADRHCLNCSDDFTPSNYHDWKAPTTTATCTEGGVEAQYCKNCDETKVIGAVDALGHNHVLDTTHADYVAAQIGVPGVDVFVCTRCDDTYTEPSAPLSGVEIIGSVANATNPDNDMIVNNGVIAYTVSIKGLVSIYSLSVDVSFDNTKLDYIGYVVGDNGTNAFGSDRFTIGTAVGGGNVAGTTTTLGFYAYTENTANGLPADITLEGESAFVTVFFRVKGTVHADDPAITTVTDTTSITLGNAKCITAADDPSTTADDVVTSLVDAAAITIHKLGNLSGEGTIGDEDLAAIRQIIVKQEQNPGEDHYDARADINADGIVSVTDLLMLTKIKVYTLGYDDIANDADFDKDFSPADYKA